MSSFQLVLPFIFEQAPSPAKTNYEYFVLISPDEAVQSKAKLKKKELHAEIGISKENLASLAHISLFKFMHLQDEEVIRTCIKQALENSQPFPVEINRLEVFDQGLKKSIVLTFKEPDPINQLRESLLQELDQRAPDMQPHMTIARSIHNYNFNRIGNLKNYFFNGSFGCNKVTVLRRPLNKRARYEVFDEIELAGTKEIVLDEYLAMADYLSAS